MSAISEPVIVTVVHGRFHLYFAGWLRNLRASGCRSLVHVIVLDAAEIAGEAEGVEVHHRTLSRVERWSGDYLRLTLIRELCARGQTCMQIDLDTFFNQNPARLCDLPYDFIISRGLGWPEEAIGRWGFSLCTGFYIVKPGAAALIDAWLALRTHGRGLDQENLNMMLLTRNVTWSHAASPLIRDALLTSDEGDVCVLPDRTITRDCSFESFRGVHNASVLARHV